MAGYANAEDIDLDEESDDEDDGPPAAARPSEDIELDEESDDDDVEAGGAAGAGGDAAGASATAPAAAPDVDDMSVKQLRELLTQHGVDFTHCLEKSEFRALARQCLGASAATSAGASAASTEGGELCEEGKAEAGGAAGVGGDAAYASTAAYVDDMSLRQLRELLAEHGVDFSHCLEKGEFRALARQCLATGTKRKSPEGSN